MKRCVCGCLHFIIVMFTPSTPPPALNSFQTLPAKLSHSPLFFLSLCLSPTNTPWTRHPALLTAAPMKLVATYGRSSHQHRSAPPARLSRNNLLHISGAALPPSAVSLREEKKKSTTRRIRLVFLSNLAGQQSLLEKEKCFNFLSF